MQRVSGLPPPLCLFIIATAAQLLALAQVSLHIERLSTRHPDHDAHHDRIIPDGDHHSPVHLLCAFIDFIRLPLRSSWPEGRRYMAVRRHLLCTPRVWRCCLLHHSIVSIPQCLCRPHRL